MSDKIRVGLVGAAASGRSWGSVAHVPAIRAVPSMDLAAVCTRRLESAKAAAEAFNVERYYHDINHLVEDDELDLISVVVKVPGHFDAVTAALRAGKHVYCEWPLGGDLEQTKAMADLCRRQGVIGAAGLQGRHDPQLSWIKELFENGWFGSLLSVEMSMVMKGAPREQRSASVPGASMFAIAGGHTLDALTSCFGDIQTLQARVGQAGADSFQTKAMAVGMLDEAADYIGVSGQLANGAFLSAHILEVPDHNSGWRMTARGTAATLVASTSILPQISPITIRGAKVGRELSEMTAPRAKDRTLAGAQGGPPRNIAIAYSELAKAIRNGHRFRADFEDAYRTYQLLSAIQQSSDGGQIVKMPGVGEEPRTASTRSSGTPAARS